MIKNWNEMKVKHLLRIRDINALQKKTDDEKNLMVGAVLAEMDYDDFIQLPLSKTEEVMNAAMFLTEKPKIEKVKNHYVINNKEFNLLKRANELTVAQYIDFQMIQNDGFENHIPEMLAIFLVPKGHKYNDGYNNEEVVDDMLEMSVKEAYTIADFFTQKYLKLMKHTLRYLKVVVKTIQVTTRKKDREKMKAIALEMNLAITELEHLYGSLLLKQ